MYMHYELNKIQNNLIYDMKKTILHIYQQNMNTYLLEALQQLAIEEGCST
jgi:hypothetical protein